MSKQSSQCPRLSTIHLLLAEKNTAVTEYLRRMKLDLKTFQYHNPKTESYQQGMRYTSCWLGFGTSLNHFADFALKELSYYSLSADQKKDYFLGIIDGVVDHISSNTSQLRVI